MLAHDIRKGLRTQDIQTPYDITFDTMLLAANTLKGLQDSGFFKPSPIQLHGIPLGKCGFDLLLEAKSGTGKTAVFSIIALEKLDMEKSLQTVILAPTREIAAQVCDVIKHIGSKYQGLKVEVVMGGLPIEEDILKFKKKNVHIVVGSPGRLRYLIQDQHIDVSAVRLLVLDEADKLMEKSFQEDIKYIFSVLPAQKQVIMSSATYAESSKLFINQYVQNVQHICPDSNSILLGIEQRIAIVKYNSNIVKQTRYRFQELLEILSKKQFKQCLIFCNYQTRVVELHKMLIKQKWPVEQLYGQQNQIDRLGALKTLQEYKCRILISTDLAARGIDASNIDLVINFEPPYEWQTYLHRIGRAGRFGSYGMAITMLSAGKEQNNFDRMLGSLKNSINLINLWAEDEYENAVFTISLPKVPVISDDIISNAIGNEKERENIKHRLEKLWTLLTFKSNTRKMEKYEKFCQLFDEYNKVKMESFTDLLNSFEYQNEEPDVENNYLHDHIRTHIMSVKDYFICIEINSKNYLSINEIKSNSKNVDGNIPMFKNYTIPESSLAAPNLQNNELMNTNDLNLKQDNSDIEEYKFGENDGIEALRRAGLPTSFGHTKINQKKYKRDNENDTELYNFSCVSGENKYIEYRGNNSNVKLEIKSTNNLNNSYNANVRSFSDSKPKLRNQNLQSNTSIKETCDYTLCAHHESYSNKPNKQHAENPKTNNFNVFNNQRKTKKYYKDKVSFQNYCNWYHQLKFRAKQIEFAIYIDEMSNM